ncbi:MAG: RdgB/HAM1 family non-canonical purine NTP pyrophosphatase [Ilumatobacteraceae bacterium]
MKGRTQLVCASANPDKVAEISAILGDVVDLMPRPAGVPDVVEDADTLEGNARLKAVAICEVTGLAAVADDTGLQVEALGGAPGVFSARWAGDGCSYDDNCAKLLRELGDTDDRRAAFTTCALIRWTDGTELVVEGVCPGTIARTDRGGGGFGYDSLFVPDEGDGRTFAEMADTEKHAISHRGRAFRTLLTSIRSGQGLYG